MINPLIESISRYDQIKTELTEFVSKKSKEQPIFESLANLALVSNVKVYLDVLTKEGKLNDNDLIHLCLLLGSLSFAEAYLQKNLFDSQ